MVLGFPAYLAWRVCALLLRNPALHIIALVDAEQRASCERAADELQRVVADVAGRFRCLVWTLDAPDFGLAEPLDRLCGDVGTIVDLTDFGAPCSLIFPEPMPASLRLASHCPQLQRFDFLSSAFVSGDRRGLVAEFDFAMGQGFKNRWEERLYARERAVRVASLPVTPTIYRPTFLVGDSRTGEVEHFRGAYAPLSLIERLHDAGLPVPMIGRGLTAAPIIPVDYVAAAIARLVITPNAAGQTFHLADPDAPTVFVAYRRAAILLTGRAPVLGLDPRLARHLLRSRFGRRWDISPLLVDYLNWPVTYRTANSHALLAPVGILPPAFADYSAAVIEFFADHCDDPRFGARLA